MTPDELNEIGEALYGNDWKGQLARDLEVSDRTVRRWANGDAPIPDGLRDDLPGVIANRIEELRRLKDRLMASKGDHA